MNVTQISWRVLPLTYTTPNTRLLVLAYRAAPALGDTAHAQSAGRQGQPQSPDRSSSVRDSDLEAGAAVDSFIDAISGERPRETAATRALGGKRSKAVQRPEWSARLARNPKPDDGNPPY